MLSKAISYISQKHPDYTINQIRFIANKNLIEIAGQEHAILVRDRANIKLFDTLNGVYIGGRNGEDLNWHFRISEAADPLHFGTFDSWIYRYLWFAFGLGLSLLCLSGVYMFTLRLKQTNDFSTLKNGHWLSILWQKTHWLKWPSLVLLVICCLLTFIDFVVK